MAEKVPGLNDAQVARELAFTPDEYQRRQRGVRQQMSGRGIDVLVVTTPENINYLSGYSTPGYYMSQCLLLPANGEPIIVCGATEEMNDRLAICGQQQALAHVIARRAVA